MRISISFLSRGPNSSAEEACSVAKLRIQLGRSNVTDMRISSGSKIVNHIVMPVYPLAEALAYRWWQILYGRGRLFSLRTIRSGFVLPDISIVGLGNGELDIKCEPFRYENPSVLFVEKDHEYVDIEDLEAELEQFFESVIDRLASNGIAQTLLSERFDLIQSSRDDSAEEAFCRACGALGVDPYAADESVASFIQSAAEVFDGDSLEEFLAGISLNNGTRAIEWLQHSEKSLGDHARLDAVLDLKRQMNFNLQRGAAYEEGYRSAVKARQYLGVQPDASFKDVPTLAARLGNKNFRLAERWDGNKLRGVSRVLMGDARTIVASARNREAELFSLGRTVGDAIHFGTPRHSPVKEQSTYRQRLGRAFAAEFVAPASAILAMSNDGQSVDMIANHFGVEDDVITHQIDNASNWLI